MEGTVMEKQRSLSRSLSRFTGRPASSPSAIQPNQGSPTLHNFTQISTFPADTIRPDPSAPPEPHRLASAVPVRHEGKKDQISGHPTADATRAPLEPTGAHTFAKLPVRFDDSHIYSSRQGRPTPINSIHRYRDEHHPTIHAGNEDLAHELSHVTRQEVTSSQRHTPLVAPTIVRSNAPPMVHRMVLPIGNLDRTITQSAANLKKFKDKEFEEGREGEDFRLGGNDAPLSKLQEAEPLYITGHGSEAKETRGQVFTRDKANKLKLPAPVNPKELLGHTIL